MGKISIRANRYRTHTCGELRQENAGERVRLSGWVNTYRDMGGVIFVDLRDRTGITQVVFDPERSGKEAHQLADTLRAEWVVSVEGTVRLRGEERLNPKLATGEVELEADRLEILSPANTPPIEIKDDLEAGEEIRGKYRYLDLRRAPMQRVLEVRHRAFAGIRRYLDALGFLEVETPFLGKSTPEGARDYLVPSRLYPGKFYALPQSPQMYKQLLMIAGFDRYYQLVRCMRDEDLRKDRQPEFTQLDIEMSFATQDDIFAVTEGAMAAAFQTGIGVEIPTPFPRITYDESLAKYGDDKPDLRYALELTDVTELASTFRFQVFRQAAASGGVVKGLRCPGWGGKSNQYLNKTIPEELRTFGARGVTWFKVTEVGLDSPAAKHFLPEEQRKLVELTGAQPGDALLFLADVAKATNQSLAYLRNKIGEEMGAKDPRRFAFLWVTDFPLFGWNEKEGCWESEHHPFTGCREDDLPYLDTDPGKCHSTSYDLVLNGYECGSGSIRIHQREVQEKVFRLLKLSEADIAERFGFFNEALSYGTPPHGGIAPGMDRLISLMMGLEGQIREVIAFPKTQSAVDLMSGAPGEVSPRQLDELKLRVVRE